jgi:hypothetical protein
VVVLGFIEAISSARSICHGDSEARVDSITSFLDWNDMDDIQEDRACKSLKHHPPTSRSGTA